MSLLSRIYRAGYPFFKVYLRVFKPKGLSAGVIITHNKEALLVKNTYGDQRWWSFPGGGIKKGESPELAAKREVREEVGLDIGFLKEIGSFPFTKHYRNDIVHVFITEAKDKTINIDNNEILDAKWILVNDIREADLSDVGILMFQTFKNYYARTS